MKLFYGFQLALLSASSLAARPRVDNLVHGPEQGSTWSRTLELRTEYELQELWIRRGDERISWFGNDPRVEQVDTLHLQTTDEFLPPEKGQPSSLRRTYDEAWLKLEVAGEPDRTGESALQGEMVAFHRDVDDPDVQARFVDRKGRDDLLIGLQADLDFKDWMPDEGLVFGEAWDLPAAAMLDWLQPGGSLSMEFDREVDSMYPMDSERLGELEGGLTLRWIDQLDSDGKRLAVISVQGLVSKRASYSGEMPIFMIGRVLAHIEEQTEYEITGELCWDLDLGMLSQISARAELQCSQRMVATELVMEERYGLEVRYEGFSQLDVRVASAD